MRFRYSRCLRPSDQQRQGRRRERTFAGTVRRLGPFFSRSLSLSCSLKFFWYLLCFGGGTLGLATPKKEAGGGAGGGSRRRREREIERETGAACRPFLRFTCLVGSCRRAAAASGSSVGQQDRSYLVSRRRRRRACLCVRVFSTSTVGDSPFHTTAGDYLSRTKAAGENKYR